jgi:hypothetical protein
MIEARDDTRYNLPAASLTILRGKIAHSHAEGDSQTGR